METVKIHLDTDLGADVDDLCALLYLLREPRVRITGITTTLENAGRRAAYVRRILDMESKIRPLLYNIPVAAGTDGTLSGDKDYDFTFQHEEKMFGEKVSGGKASENDGPGDSVSTLYQSIEQGAKLVAIGPLTNIALFEKQHPGLLNRDNFYLMGGCVHRPEPGWPQWGPVNDWNLHMDRKAAAYVLNRVPVTMVEVAATLKTFLTERNACVLEGKDALCALTARQGRYWRQVAEFIPQAAASCDRLPGDLLNFHYDPLTAAVAVGFERIKCEEKRLCFEEAADGGYRLTEKEEGNPVRLVTDVDGEAFNRYWLDCVCG